MLAQQVLRIYPGGMSPSTPDRAGLRISDPERMRALAHPVRLDLLSYLDDAGEATATECAAHLRQTVANCSFHLRTLAKAGYVEPAEPRGRERPWRAVARERSFTADPLDPASRRAVLELGEMAARREVERYIDHLRRTDASGALDPATVPLTQTSSHGFWATPEEATELIATMNGLSDRFAGRAEDPGLRPAGARLMRLFTAINPDLDHEPAPADPPSPSTPAAPRQQED